MGLNKYQKGDFNSSTDAFYQKSIFDFLSPFTNISGYFNLRDIFRFIFRQLIVVEKNVRCIFRQLRMAFFHKIMVAEKYNFSSNM